MKHTSSNVRANLKQT